MRREYFGLPGSLLDDRELARYMVMHAVAPSALRGLLRGNRAPAAVLGELTHIGRVRSTNVSQGENHLRIDLGAARRIALSTDADVLPSLRAYLDMAWRGLQQPGMAQFSVTLHGGPTHLDRQWLAQMFVQEPSISSVVFEANRPEAGQWSWPLRVGLPNTSNGQQLYEALELGNFRELYLPLVVERAGEQVDLLLMPEPLVGVEAMYDKSEVVADAVLVLGDADVDARNSGRRMRALMRQFASGLSGLCYVPRGERGSWFQALVRELSHNRSLPNGLFAARSGVARMQEGGALERELSAPVLFGDSAFVVSTSFGDTARRLALRLRDLDHGNTIPIDPRLASALGNEQPATLPQLGEAIERYRSSWGWQREIDEATTLVRLIRTVEQTVGSLDLSETSPTLNVELARAAPAARRERTKDFIAEIGPESDVSATIDPLPPWTSINHGPPPAPPTEDVPARHLQMDVLQLSSPWSRRTLSRVENLAADSNYRLRIHIGCIHADSSPLVSTRPLDEGQLPPSSVGHHLKIVYCPLSEAPGADGTRGVPAPTQAMMHLPSTVGDSERVEFVIRTGADPGAFRARTIVLHENRVLETHLISTDSDGRPRLHRENQYAPGFAAVHGAQAADIAFVINDDPQGRPGLTTIVQDTATFYEPPGLEKVLEQMRTLLSTANRESAGRRKPKLERPEVVTLLFQLANLGWEVLRKLKANLRFAGLEAATRVHIVEAVDKAFFPVEFLYSGSAPELGATLCPKAAAALANQSVHDTCENAGKSSHVCPLAFWGFHKCIERHPSTGSLGHNISVPTPGNSRLGPFARALVAASQIAKAEMQGPKGVPTVVGEYVANVSKAGSWKEWTARVASEDPDVLLLMPHSLESPDVAGLEALEVSGENLTSSHFTSGHVRKAGLTSQGPLVLLLGCSTALTQTPFLGFVYKFHEGGAPVVVGTLATVHSTQAAMVACRVIAGLKSPGQPDSRFDEAMLKLRRQLLSEGHEVALSLVAYGHSSWRI